MEWQHVKTNNPDAWEEISRVCKIDPDEGMAVAMEKIKNQLRRDTDGRK